MASEAAREKRLENGMCWYKFLILILMVHGFGMLLVGILATRYEDGEHGDVPYYTGGYVVGILNMLLGMVCMCVVKNGQDARKNNFQDGSLGCSILCHSVMTFLVLFGNAMSAFFFLGNDLFAQRNDISDPVTKQFATLIFAGCVSGVALGVVSLCTVIGTGHCFSIGEINKQQVRNAVHTRANRTNRALGYYSSSPRVGTIHPHINTVRAQVNNNPTEHLEVQNYLLQQQVELQQQMIQLQAQGNFTIHPLKTDGRRYQQHAATTKQHKLSGYTPVIQDQHSPQFQPAYNLTSTAISYQQPIQTPQISPRSQDQRSPIHQTFLSQHACIDGNQPVIHQNSTSPRFRLSPDSMDTTSIAPKTSSPRRASPNYRTMSQHPLSPSRQEPPSQLPSSPRHSPTPQRPISPRHPSSTQRTRSPGYNAQAQQSRSPRHQTQPQGQIIEGYQPLILKDSPATGYRPMLPKTTDHGYRPSLSLTTTEHRHKSPISPTTTDRGYQSKLSPNASNHIYDSSLSPTTNEHRYQAPPTPTAPARGGGYRPTQTPAITIDPSYQSNTSIHQSEFNNLPPPPSYDSLYN